MAEMKEKWRKGRSVTKRKRNGKKRHGECGNSHSTQRHGRAVSFFWSLVCLPNSTMNPPNAEK